MAKCRVALGVFVLLSGSAFSLAQTATANAIDPETIGRAYRENPVKADLLYKGKVLTVEGVVTAISNNSAHGEVGSVSFASPSDVKKRFGGRSALQGVVGASDVTIWSCSFDASRVEELAQLRANDMVILEGQLARYSDFRHCHVVTKEAAPPEEAPRPRDAVHDPSASRKDCQVETKGALPEEFHMGDGVSPPKAVFAPDPEYAEEARKAKLQGKCVLRLVVGTDGCAHDIRVVQSLGLGLDEKAMEAVKTWKFEPAMRDGKPVAVQINVETAFRLYDGELRSTLGDLGLPSGLIATTRSVLEILRQKGGRNYYEFTLVKGAGPQPVSTVSLQLKRTNPRKETFTLTVAVGNKTIEKKDRNIIEPIQFYAGRDHLLYEVIVWSVDDEKVAGYLSAPQ